ncbi:MAG: hypothetical protein F6K16_40040, partial [Symploca sp. SIO2B6]|nr:hypothetical protein [Symploca sp. SIO2B6]
HSPFNVGVPIELTELEQPLCLELATRYRPFLATEVDLEEAFGQIHGLIGGHPYLLNMAFYHLAKGNVNVETLLQDAPTQMGIYKEHLRTHLVTVQQTPGLADALTTIVRANSPVHVNVLTAYRLYSLGLIKFVGNDVCPRCELYRQYFRYQLN